MHQNTEKLLYAGKNDCIGSQQLSSFRELEEFLQLMECAYF